jgi:RNA polymerase sigma-70 factor (ECF subfamily)
MPRSDGELVVQVRDGDTRAASKIVGRYQSLVFNIIYHYLGRSGDVEDIAQEVFLKFFQRLDHYDTSRPLKHWIAKIAVNRSLDELRKLKGGRLRYLSDLNIEEQGQIEALYEAATHSKILTGQDTEKCLDLLTTALNSLSEKDRTAFVLRELEDLEYREVAEIMDTSELAVRIRVSRSKKKLQEELEGLLG